MSLFCKGQHNGLLDFYNKCRMCRNQSGENTVNRGGPAGMGWDGTGGELHRVVPQDWLETQYVAEF